MKTIQTIVYLNAFSISITLAQPNVYFGNLHSHTSYSDGSATPEVAYRYARDVAKIDFLAITEHNHSSAGRIQNDPELYNGTVSTSLISSAKRFNEDGRFIALYGQEFSSISKGNHANVFEVSQVIKTLQVPNGAWDKLLNEWLPENLDSEGNQAILLLNHPATGGSPNNLEYGRDDFSDFKLWVTTLDAYAQLINIVNGPSHDIGSPPGRDSESEFLRYLNMGFHLAPTADQDNHKENWGDAADTRTGIIAPSLTKSNILTAMRERNVYASEDKNLKVIATINGNLIGSKLRGNDVPAVNSSLDIEIIIEDPDEPNAFYTIDIYKDNIGGDQVADIIQEVNFTGDGTYSIPEVTYDGGNQYFFIKINQTDDDAIKVDRVWMAPVWFEPDDVSRPIGPNSSVTLLVNERTEEATITNIGITVLNLKNWELVSVKGDQRFKFRGNRMLNPGESVTITAGPNAIEDATHIKWTDQYIWNNSGDPGRLLDSTGKIVVETNGVVAEAD